MSELRDAFRALRATPIVTLVAVLSLALGIGANTALFSIVDGLMLRTLPVERPERLAVVLRDSKTSFSSFTNPLWEAIRDRPLAPVETAFAYALARFNLAKGGETQFVDGLYTSGTFFSGLGVRPALGRTFTPEDDRRGGGPDGAVAVISHDFWQRRFGGAPDAIGKAVVLEGVPFTVIGVTPPRFFGVEVGRGFDVAIPIGTEPLIRRGDSALDQRSAWWLRIMVRVKDNASLTQAEQALRAVQPQVREATLPPNYTEANKARYMSAPLAMREASTGASGLRTRYRTPLMTLMGVVGLVLLIACANIANLQLARGTARRHELSVRRALGAPRFRLARLVLAESLLLAGAGAALGLLLAQWGSALLLRQLSTRHSLVIMDLPLDWRMLAFTTLVAVTTAILFGLAPALRAARAEPIDAMREHGRGASGERRLAFGNLLVAGQVALSLVLIIGAGLFLGTFGRLASKELGFDREPIMVVEVDTTRTSAKDDPARVALYRRVVDAVRELPGVAHAGMSAVTPVSGSIWNTGMAIEGEAELPEGERRLSYVHLITSDWFATYGTPIARGRGFGAGDAPAAPKVVVVNEAFVRRFFKDREPIGRRVRQLGGPRDPIVWAEIVGVAKDAVYNDLREPPPATIYYPVAQYEEVPPELSLSVRVAQGAPGGFVKAIGQALARVDPALSLTFTPLAQQVDDELVQERTLAMLSTFFGGLALLLAGLGLYGVTTYAVNRRRGEIGIRMALGATAPDVVRMVLTRVGGTVTLGVAAGAALALWLSRFVEALLFGLPARDLTTFAAAAGVLIAVGALAGWLPARRASRIDPARVLRNG